MTDLDILEALIRHKIAVLDKTITEISPDKYEYYSTDICEDIAYYETKKSVLTDILAEIEKLVLLAEAQKGE
jgi:hypothetical protein